MSNTINAPQVHTPASMSRSPTFRSEDAATLTDQALDKGSPGHSGHDLPSESTLGVTEKRLEAEGKIPPHDASKRNALADLPASRKNILTFAFCLAMFIDAAGVSATFLMTEPIAKELSIKFADEAWILGTYSLAFSSTLLFAGRLADLYPPHLVYTIGFFGIGVFYLIISFMHDQYAFFVLRAFSALLAVLTIPSSLNMIVQMFPDPTEQAQRLALFGMAGALANVLALVLAGLFLLSSWRWYFRFVTILVLPFSVLAWFAMPKTEAVAQSLPGWQKIKRMDLGGVGLIMAALILFILGFTQAPVDGWSSAIFLAPFIIALVLFVVFVVWEQYMPKGYALLPHDIWRYPNILPLVLQASSVFAWMATAQLRIATFDQSVNHHSAILTAVRLLPMGIVAIVVGVLTQVFPWLITRPRYVQPIASALCFAGSMMYAYSNGGTGKDYWRFMFPAHIIGTAGGMIIFIGMQTSIIMSFPLEFAGVGGSFAQVVFQIGGVAAIAIQSGLGDVDGGGLANWTNSAYSYYFTSGYIMLTGLLFVLIYRQEKMPVREGPVVAA